MIKKIHVEKYRKLEIMTVPLTQEEWKRQRQIYLEQDISEPLRLGFATFFLNRTNVSGGVNGGMVEYIKKIFQIRTCPLCYAYSH